MQKLSREVLEHRRFSLRAAGAPVIKSKVDALLEKKAVSSKDGSLLDRFSTPLLLAGRGYLKVRMSGGDDG